MKKKVISHEGILATCSSKVIGAIGNIPNSVLQIVSKVSLSSQSVILLSKRDLQLRLRAIKAYYKQTNVASGIRVQKSTSCMYGSLGRSIIRS